MKLADTAVPAPPPTARQEHTPRPAVREPWPVLVLSCCPVKRAGTEEGGGPGAAVAVGGFSDHPHRLSGRDYSTDRNMATTTRKILGKNFTKQFFVHTLSSLKSPPSLNEGLWAYVVES